MFDLIVNMQQASDCDMMLTHDDDLVTIDGLGHDAVSRPLNISYYTVPSFLVVTGNPRTRRDDGYSPEVQHRDRKRFVWWAPNFDRVTTLILTRASTPKDLRPTDGGPNTDTSFIKIAMISMNRSR